MIQAYQWVREQLDALGAEVYMFQHGPDGPDMLGIGVKSPEGPRWLRLLDQGHDLNTAPDKQAIVERFYRRHQSAPLEASDRTTFDWPWWEC